MLRVLRGEPGLSQQELAGKLGMVPSRVVVYVDDLEARGWVTRARAADRRGNKLTVTHARARAVAVVAGIARGHEAKNTARPPKAGRGAVVQVPPQPGGGGGAP